YRAPSRTCSDKSSVAAVAPPGYWNLNPSTRITRCPGRQPPKQRKYITRLDRDAGIPLTRDLEKPPSTRLRPVGRALPAMNAPASEAIQDSPQACPVPGSSCGRKDSPAMLGPRGACLTAGDPIIRCNRWVGFVLHPRKERGVRM